MKELWKEIEGTEGQYEFSNTGKVKSLGNNRTRKEKILKGLNDTYTLFVDGRYAQIRKIDLYNAYFPDEGKLYLEQKKARHEAVLCSYDRFIKKHDEKDIVENADGLTMIPGFENYFADRNGNAYIQLTNHKYGLIRKTEITSENDKKYNRVPLNGKSYCLNRVIARTFLRKEDGSLLDLEYKNDRHVVDHINGNTLDNSVDNLEIISQSENIKRQNNPDDDEWTAKNFSTGKIVNGRNADELLKNMGEEMSYSNRVALTICSRDNKTFKKNWKISKKNKLTRSHKKEIVLTDGQGNKFKYEQLTSAAKFLGITPATLSNITRHENPKCKGFKIEKY